MSNTNVPYGAGSGPQHPPGQTGVKERMADAASNAGDAGRETAHDAKERAREVAHEAGDQARGLADQARTELRSQAQSQQQHLAGGLRALGDELGQMARGTQDPGYATDLVQRAGDASGRAAQWFEDREPMDVLHEVEDFARRRPGMFIALAAGAGLLAGRLLRGAKDASGDRDAAEAERGAGYAPAASARHQAGAPAATSAPGPTSAPAGTGAGTTPPAFPPPTPGTSQPLRTGGEPYVDRT